MKNIVEIIIKDLVLSIYPGLMASFVFAVLFMAVYNYALKMGVKSIIREWIDSFKNDRKFRSKFLFAVYIFLVFTKTVFFRSYQGSPIANVWGYWHMYTEEGKINTELFENFILFVPLPVCVFFAYPKRIFGRKRRKFFTTVLKGIEISFAVSCLIEIIQMFFKLGTFQISDLVFNTLGGLFGSILYYVYIKLLHKRKKH